MCDIFHYAGEEYFRKAERGMLEQLIASGDDLVVSTGGGLPVWADNMARMNGAGLTVYIRRSAEQIAARLSPHGRWKRPKLRDSTTGSWSNSCRATWPSGSRFTDRLR